MMGLRGAYLTTALSGARWLALFAVAFALDAGRGFDPTDESWFLQVARRVASGDVLYRDVFFGATPLAVYLTAGAVWVLGAEVVVLKAIVSAIFTATLAVSLALARRFGATRRAEIAIVAALFLFALPTCAPAYTPLANLFLLATLHAVLGWIGDPADGGDVGRRAAVDRKRTPAERRSQASMPGEKDAAVPGRRRLLVAGVLAGLCFGAKWNLGFFALAALAGTILVAGRGLGRGGVARSLALASMAFCATAAASLLPVLLSGGFERFLEYGFLGKTVYVKYGRSSYLDELATLGRLAFAPTQDPETLARWTCFLVPPIALAGLAVLCLRGRRDPRVTALGLFGVAAALGLFPNPILRHVTDVVPALIVGLAAAWARFKGPIGPWAAGLARLAAAVWLGLGLALIAGTPAVRLARGEIRPSPFPHFRGALVYEEDIGQLARAIEALGPIAGERPLLLTPYASFFYLSAGIHSPTAFDYPLLTPFGRHGQEDTIAAIERGEIRCVAWHVHPARKLRPETLEQYLVERMDGSESRGPWTVYRKRSAPR